MAEVAIPWRWTADAFEVAAEAGAFGDPARVELIDAEVYEIASMLPSHASTVGRLARYLGDHLDVERWTVRPQLPVRLDDHSEPEPDVALAEGPAERYDTRHPGPSDLVLAAEVSDTSEAFDRTVKLPLYARFGIEMAWIVSLRSRTITSYTAPRGDEYQAVEVAREGDALAVAGLEVPVRAVLPALA